LMMSIFGNSYGYRSEGELIINGKKQKFKEPRAAINSGLGYISEDRKNLGLVLIQDVKTNITHASLNKISNFGIIDNQKEIREAERYRKDLNIRTPSINQIVRNLSGGNQQKVVVSKTLFANPDILIVDEPTRGIDVGAKTEIYGILNNMIAD
ncbi:ATP-binding cassette domain-containing protein, partial [Treponema sp. R6D11]